MTSAIDGNKMLALYPALRGFPDGLLDMLLQSNATVRVEAGTRLFAECQPCNGFPLVIDGSVKVVKYASSGRELLLYRVVPGSSCIISTSCLLGSSDYSACGIAEADTTLMVLPTPEFNRQLIANPPFRDFVFRLFAERITDLMQLVEEVAFARLDQRLAKLIVARNSDVLQITHQELADELGSVREIVSRLLKGFAVQGLITLGREQLTIVDRGGLQKLAAM